MAARGSKSISFLFALAAIPFILALASPKAGLAKAGDVKLVELFLKTPLDQLPPDQVDAFLAVDPKGLPKRLRPRYLAKRLELLGLKKIYDAKNKGMRLKPEEDCRSGASEHESVGLLKSSGYVEISEEEENYLMEKTRCSESDLLCEFSLKIAKSRGPKGRPIRHYFLYCRASCDPLMALLDAKRQGVDNQGSDFFGAPSFPSCAHGP